MKKYKAPIIISEKVFERIALACDADKYYIRDAFPCYDTFVGYGKDEAVCYKTSS